MSSEVRLRGKNMEGRGSFSPPQHQSPRTPLPAHSSPAPHVLDGEGTGAVPWRRSMLIWVVICVIGLLIGLLSYGMTTLAALFLQLKLDAVESILDDTSSSSFIAVFTAGWIWAAIGCGFSLFAVSMVVCVSPLAAGSGLPETKGFLNGTPVSGLFSLRTLFVRALGVVCSISATLPVGREQPLIHIGAAVAHQCSHLPPVWRTIVSKKVAQDEQEKEERTYVTMGAAGGISSAYAAPVGGCLYVFEEIATFWDEKTTLKCFTTCLFAAALVSWVRFGGFLESGFEGLVIFESGSGESLQLDGWEIKEVPFIILLGLLGGLSASAFTWLALRVTHLRRTLRSRYGLWLQVADVAVVTVIVNITYWLIPFAFDCIKKPESSSYSGDEYRRHLLAGDGEDHHRQFYQYNCENGDFNALGSLFLTGEEGALKHLFARDVDEFSPQVLVVFFFIYFAFAELAVGLQIPMGQFIPNMLCGAAIGRLYGKLFKTWLKNTTFNIDPGVYAQIGSAAQLSGYTRMTIALTVLLTEASGDVSLMIPMMIAMLFARGVASFLILPMDEVLLEVKNITFLDRKPPKGLYGLTAKDIMHRDFRILDEECSYDEANGAVQDIHSKQVRFPVVNTEGAFIGTIARQSLLDQVRRIRLQRSEHLHLDSDDEVVENIDVYACNMNYDPYSVSPYLSMPQVFLLFRKFGLRQIFVVGLGGGGGGEAEGDDDGGHKSPRTRTLCGSEHQILGMISRHDLIDPDRHRRAQHAYGHDELRVGVAAVACGGSDEEGIGYYSDDIVVRSTSRPSSLNGGESMDEMEDIDDALVDGDASQTVVAQAKLGQARRSVLDLMATFREHATPGLANQEDMVESASDTESDIGHHHNHNNENEEVRLKKHVEVRRRTKSIYFPDEDHQGDDGNVKATPQFVTEGAASFIDANAAAEKTEKGNQNQEPETLTEGSERPDDEHIHLNLRYGGGGGGGEEGEITVSLSSPPPLHVNAAAENMEVQEEEGKREDWPEYDPS